MKQIKENKLKENFFLSFFSLKKSYFLWVALMRLCLGYCAGVAVWCGPSSCAPGHLSLLLSTPILRLSTSVTVVTH
jgi:hypothetical protein